MVLTEIIERVMNSNVDDKSNDKEEIQEMENEDEDEKGADPLLWYLDEHKEEQKEAFVEEQNAGLDAVDVADYGLADYVGVPPLADGGNAANDNEEERKDQVYDDEVDGEDGLMGFLDGIDLGGSENVIPAPLLMSIQMDIYGRLLRVNVELDSHDEYQTLGEFRENGRYDKKQNHEERKEEKEEKEDEEVEVHSPSSDDSDSDSSESSDDDDDDQEDEDEDEEEIDHLSDEVKVDDEMRMRRR